MVKESADTDGDGLLDSEEIDTYGTDPLVADTDGDGLNDGDEVENGTDPLCSGKSISRPKSKGFAPSLQLLV